MTDNEKSSATAMSDNEIIESLECCIASQGKGCAECPYRKYLEECRTKRNNDCIDIINRKNAEIERLTVNMNAFGLGMKREKERADTIKAEAVKEVFEKVFECSDVVFDEKAVRVVDLNFLKMQMVGDAE